MSITAALRALPVIGTINVDDPHDPRHKEWTDLGPSHPVGALRNCTFPACDCEDNTPEKVLRPWAVIRCENKPKTARLGNWMLTSMGVQYFPIDPRSSEVFITDIAHSLSMQCRYAGHCREFYSVAEHSVYVSRLVPREHALLGLMHDAAEAYCVDVPRPLKGHLREYAAIELRNWEAIAEAFWLPRELPSHVHQADEALCATEMAQLLPESPIPLGLPKGPDIVIQCLPPKEAKALFLDTFHELMKEKH